MKVNHYFSPPEILSKCSFLGFDLDNLVSYLKSTAESSIATKPIQTSLRFYVPYNFNPSLPSQFLLVISVTTFSVHVRQILKYLPPARLIVTVFYQPTLLHVRVLITQLAKLWYQHAYVQQLPASWCSCTKCAALQTERECCCCMELAHIRHLFSDVEGLQVHHRSS